MKSSKGLAVLTGRLLCGAAIAAVAASAASAQSDEIIVTATKREQSLQQVPIAVSVVDDVAIERSSVQDLDDLQTLVPSLRISTLQNSSQTNFIIRGFGNGANNPGIESSVGVFIDGVYRSRSAAAILDLPVLERVEILRGPQSTLFGKNTSAGAISITTKQPQFEWGGSGEVSYGRFDEVIFKSTVTGPISDKVAFRLSGSSNNRDGYYVNQAGGSNLNERDRWSVRADVIFEPSDTLKFRLIGDYNKIDEVCCGAVQLINGASTLAIGAPPPFGLGLAIDPAGDTDRSVAFSTQVRNRLTGKGVSLQGDLDLGGVALTSITSYREQSDDANTDADFSAADIADNPQTRSYDTFTQELRLASTGDNMIDWLIGAFYFDEKVNSTRDVTWGQDARGFFDILAVGAGAPGALAGLEAALFGLPAVNNTFFQPGQGVFGTYAMDNTSYSVFANVDFNLTERLTISGGVAYINDEKNVVGNSLLTDPFSQISLPQIGFASAFGAIAMVPPTPANLANPIYAGAVAAASAIAVTPCSIANPPPACNTALALASLQLFQPQINFPNATPGDDGAFKDDEVVYTGRVAFDVADWLNAYFTYSKGWKAAAVNLSSDSAPPGVGGGRSAGPEDVTLYEAGLKTQFDGGYLNIAVFDQTIEGFQSNLFVGTGFALLNAGEQSVRGFEVDSGWRPVEPLSLTFGLTYLDPNYDSFPNAPCTTFVGITVSGCAAGPVTFNLNGPPTSVTFDASGFTPAGISKWSIATSATYTVPVGDNASGYIRGEYAYESNTQVIDNVSAAIASRTVNNVNASVGVDFDNGLSLQFWARNLLDKSWLLSAFPSVAQPGSFSGYYNEPRTFGGTVRMSF